MKVDLIITNIGKLVTCASEGKPKRNAAMSELGIIENGAVAIKDGTIIAIGRTQDISHAYNAAETLDAQAKVVCPGFVDPHTHIVFAGDRLNEFELKIKGAEYLEILESGGGIISTVRETRTATVEDLVLLATARLDKMLACGTTTCEIKTGYGLDAATELKMLDVIGVLSGQHAVEIVPTFLAAHAIPPEHKNNPEAYVNLICDKMLAQAWTWFVDSTFHGKTPFFCDVFCERGAFTLDQTRRILETARSFGFKLKAHVDEFTNLGGSRLAIAMGAVSVDHLDAISADEIIELARSNTIGIITPTVNFNLGSCDFAKARDLVDKGCAVSLSTDYNPGSAPCPSQTLAMAIACRYQKLLPAEALNAVTINAAYAIGQGHRTGSIEVGKRADLLIVETSDHRDLAYEFGGNLVSTVIKGGKVVVNR
jgi:imidazolonepropionase